MQQRAGCLIANLGMCLPSLSCCHTSHTCLLRCCADQPRLPFSTCPALQAALAAEREKASRRGQSVQGIQFKEVRRRMPAGV